jgi:hypothetical protein
MILDIGSLMQIKKNTTYGILQTLLKGDHVVAKSLLFVLINLWERDWFSTFLNLNRLIFYTKGVGVIFW